MEQPQQLRLRRRSQLRCQRLPADRGRQQGRGRTPGSHPVAAARESAVRRLARARPRVAVGPGAPAGRMALAGSAQLAWLARRRDRPHPAARTLVRLRSSPGFARAAARCRSARSRGRRWGDPSRPGRCRRCALRRGAHRRRCSPRVLRAAARPARLQARSGRQGLRMRPAGGRRSPASAAKTGPPSAREQLVGRRGRTGSWGCSREPAARPSWPRAAPRSRVLPAWSPRPAPVGGRTAAPRLSALRQGVLRARLAQRGLRVLRVLRVRRVPRPREPGRQCPRGRRTSSGPGLGPRRRCQRIRSDRRRASACSWEAHRTPWSAARRRTRREPAP